MTIMTSVTMYHQREARAVAVPMARAKGARLASVCRVIVMSGGLTMVVGAGVMAGGNKPQASHAIVAQFDPAPQARTSAWSDPAWLIAFTGLLSVVGGYFSPVILKAMDNTKQTAMLTAKIDELTRKLEESDATNRRLTGQSIVASNKAIAIGTANGDKIDRMTTAVDNAANAPPQQQTITTLKTTTITPANIVFPDDDESTVEVIPRPKA